MSTVSFSKSRSEGIDICCSFECLFGGFVAITWGRREAAWDFCSREGRTLDFR